MNTKIINILKSTAGRLIFVLLSGLGYFAIISKLILDFSARYSLLLFFFAPVIICGTGLVLIKMLKQHQDGENDSGVLKLFYLNTVVIIIGIVFAISIFA